MLAWVWMVPMLLALKSVESFPKFLRNVYLTLACTAAVGMAWLSLSTSSGYLLLLIFFPLILSVPLVAFYFVRRSFGWRAALLSLPMMWTAWEWLYHGTEGSIGWIPISVTQSNAIWLVQYIDITGVWGITFWLVLFNVLIVMTIDDWQRAKTHANDEQSATRFLTRRLAAVAVLMLAPPLTYAAFIFLKDARPSPENEREINVMLVQPNINAWEKMSADARPAVLRKTIALTNRALAKAETKPDLIIFPETAVPYVLSQNKDARETVYRAVTRWGTPLLTGLMDLSEEGGAAETSAHEREAVFNSAALLAPAPEVAGRRLNVEMSPVYHKRVLVPFVERVPYADRFPALQSLAIDIGAGDDFSSGREATVFPFRTRQGAEVKVAAAICYEYLYPAQVAELVRGGAQMLAFITNEGWFSQTHGQYQLAAFSRLRSIETRRATARTANTGVTWLIDSLGRVHQQSPWWSEQTLQGRLKLSNEMSLYVRFTDYFPKACLWFTLAIMAASLAHSARQKVRQLMRRREAIAVSRCAV